MTIGNDYQSILRELQGAFNGLGGTSVVGSSYLNSIWGAGQNIYTLADQNTSSDQKANAMQGLLDKALSLIMSLAKNEAQKASKEVQEGAKKAEETEDKIKKQRTELSKNIDEINGEIEAENNNVQCAVETANDANEELKAKQEEITEKIKQIQALQAELATETNPQKQADLLGYISNLSSQITSIITSISEIKETLKSCSEEVETAVKNIETARGNSVQLQENGSLQIQELVNEEATQVNDATRMGTEDAAKHYAIKTSAEALATESAVTSVFTFGVTTEVTEQATEVAIDQGIAANTKKIGGIANLRTLLQGIGGLQDNTQLLTQFKNSIGSSLESFNGLVGNWNSAIEPVITSIGSIESVSMTELNSAVATDLKTVQDAGADLCCNPDEETPENNADQTPATKENNPIDLSNNAESKLKTPKVLITNNFGI